jgi:hypothetical protein
MVVNAQVKRSSFLSPSPSYGVYYHFPPSQPLRVHKLSQEEMVRASNAFDFSIIVMRSFSKGINAKNKIISNGCVPT